MPIKAGGRAEAAWADQGGLGREGRGGSPCGDQLGEQRIPAVTMLDVHKKTMAVAGRASADVRLFGTIANTPEAIRSLLRKLSKSGQPLHLAY